MRLLSLLLLLVFCFACGGGSNATSTAAEPTTPAVETSYTGDTEGICALLTEADIRVLSSFRSAPHIQSKLTNSPSGSITVCQWMAMSKGVHLVLNANNDDDVQQRLDNDIDKKGYKLIEGLGQKAAFDENKGYLKWIGTNGMLMTAYIFEKGAARPSANYQELYNLALKIEQNSQGS